MKRNPLYVFKNVSATGVYDIPLNSIMQILEVGIAPNARVLVIEIISKTGLTISATVAELLAKPDLYNILSDGTTGGEVQKYKEEVQPGVTNTGYRLQDSDPALFGPIGEKAIDFSFQESTVTFNGGATGTHSFCTGLLTISSGDNSFAVGNSTEAVGNNSLAAGYKTKAVGETSAAFGTMNTSSSNDSFTAGLRNLAEGNQSVAFGLATISSSTATFTSGYTTKASNHYAAAFGNLTEASGMCSIALGNNTKASGKNSSSQGQETKALGDNSHAEGFLSESRGENSHAEGDSNISNGIASHAEGHLTLAEGDYSHSEGNLTRAEGIASSASGTSNIASGASSTAQGMGTISSGDNSFSSGYTTQATGTNSVAFGSLGISSGDNSLVFGISGTASGPNSTSLGFNTKALQTGSVALGYKTTSDGFYSFASGAETSATGNYSAVFGSGTVSPNPGMLSLGLFNVGKVNSIFEVGIGTNTLNTKNAFEVFTNGILSAPGLLSADINTLPDEALITKEMLVEMGNNLGNALVSQLELIQENNNTGWRLLGADPASHNDIGQNAIDLTFGTFGTNFDVGAPGDYSFAGNFNTLARGNNSSSFGWSTNAEGENSFAEGKDTLASGRNSHAGGYTTHALGESSHSEGILTIAGGDYSFAGGKSTLASGYVSAAWGNLNEAIGDYSFVAGSNNIVRGENSSSFGLNNTTDANNIFIVGSDSTSSSEGTILLGNNLVMDSSTSGTIALGKYNIGDPSNILEVGNGTDVGSVQRKNALEITNDNIAFLPEANLGDIEAAGLKTIITKEYMIEHQGYLEKVEEVGIAPGGGLATRTGYRVRFNNPSNNGTIGENATDFSFNRDDAGDPTTPNGWGSTGDYSFCAGQYVEASGQSTVAFGYDSHATDPGASSFGWGTIALNVGSLASGIWNTGTSFETILEVGIGSDTTGSIVRKNALEVYQNGRVRAPELSGAIIDQDDDGLDTGLSARTLITKEYLDTHGGGGGGAQYIDELLDADTTTVAPVIDQSLMWDGTNWIPGDPDIDGGSY